MALKNLLIQNRRTNFHVEFQPNMTDTKPPWVKGNQICSNEELFPGEENSGIMKIIINFWKYFYSELIGQI